jgi:hypothetical protein
MSGIDYVSINLTGRPDWVLLYTPCLGLNSASGLIKCISTGSQAPMSCKVDFIIMDMPLTFSQIQLKSSTNPPPCVMGTPAVVGRIRDTLTLN